MATVSSRLRLNKTALFADLGYEPHPGQVEVHQSQASRRVLACAVRWGKSTCAAMEAVAALLEPREASLGWIVGPTYDLAHLVYRRVLRILEGHLAHRIESIVPREQRILIRNLGGGLSEVRARSADNPDSLLGEGLNWLIMDEAARLKASIWEDHLSQRLIDRGGWALLVSTPRGKGWFYRLYKKGQGKDAEFESWRFPSWANPYLDREVIERERSRLGDATWQQEYAAEFIGDEIERCEVCGDPDPAVSGCVVLDRDEEMLVCVSCGQPVDANGHTLRGLQAGKPYISIIRLYPDRADVAMPGGDLIDLGEDAPLPLHTYSTSSRLSP